MQAKFRCASVKDLKHEDGTKYAEEVTFYAVYSDDPSNPNYTWAKSTPNGNCYLKIEQEGAWGHYKVDEEYVATFLSAN